MLQVGAHQEPLDRDLGQGAVGHAVVGGGVDQLTEGHGVQLGPLVRGPIGDRPAAAERHPVEPVGIDGVLHVAGARGAGHRGPLPGVGPVADGETAAAGHERHLGSPLAQGVADHGLPVDVGRPVPWRQDRHLRAGGRQGRRDRGGGGQSTGRPLLGGLAPLAQGEVDALDGVLLEPVSGRQGHRVTSGDGGRRGGRRGSVRCRARTRGRSPSGRWPGRRTPGVGRPPGSRPMRMAATPATAPHAVTGSTAKPGRRVATPTAIPVSVPPTSAAGASGRQYGSVRCFFSVDALHSP